MYTTRQIVENVTKSSLLRSFAIFNSLHSHHPRLPNEAAEAGQASSIVIGAESQIQTGPKLDTVVHPGVCLTGFEVHEKLGKATLGAAKHLLRAEGCDTNA